MTATRIGYARCSTDEQDLAAQRSAPFDLGVAEDRIYLDRGLTATPGPTRPGPGPGRRPRRRWQVGLLRTGAWIARGLRVPAGNALLCRRRARTRIRPRDSTHHRLDRRATTTSAPLGAQRTKSRTHGASGNDDGPRAPSPGRLRPE